MMQPNLDPKQVDLLNRKIQSMESDDMLSEKSDVKGIQGSMERPDSSIYMSTDNYTQSPQQVDNIKSRIAELEKELGQTSIRDVSSDEITFMDAGGNETFYVENISGRHVLITDIEGFDKIPVGSSVDLTRWAPIEDLKKSRDLRASVYGVGPEKTLKRLTEMQFYENKKQELDNKKRIDIIRQQEELRRLQQGQINTEQLMPHERPVVANVNKIRPVIEAKLGKLALRDDKNPENARLAMTGREFITWIQSEPLTHSEIGSIMEHPTVQRDHDIRAALLEKKQRTPMG